MPKAGRYDYPLRELDDCVEFLKEGYTIVKNHVMSRETLAEAVKMSAKGGGFAGIVGTAAIYGLIETGDGSIRYTDIIKGILHGSSEEVRENKEKAVRHVKLFADIIDRYGPHPSNDQIRIFLREKALVDISEAKSVTEAVSKLLKKVSGYVTPMSSQNELNYGSGTTSETLAQREYKLEEGIVIRVPLNIPKANLVEAWKKSKVAMDIFLDVGKAPQQPITVTTSPVVTDDAEGKEGNNT